MSVVDASVWVSVFLTQDVHHQAARRWLDDRLASGETIVSPVLLLSEVGGAISRQTKSPERPLEPQVHRGHSQGCVSCRWITVWGERRRTWR